MPRSSAKYLGRSHEELGGSRRISKDIGGSREELGGFRVELKESRWNREKLGGFRLEVEEFQKADEYERRIRNLEKLRGSRST